ncbi:ubiquitin carboxyl-terminal hydrolase 5 [Spinellus fusiger]|nr:ubiquitin carboxyl-terminal hydrolase 5 [Spinellus fusiger]
MPDASQTSPELSVLDHYEIIARNEMSQIEEEIVDFQCQQWNITQWSKLEDRVYGPTFEAGGHQWNVLLFPKGNNQTEYSSLYVEMADAKSSPDNYCCAQFVVCLSKPSDPCHYVHHTAQHRFNSEESDWGFTRFIDCKQLSIVDEEGEPRFLKDDSIRITTILRVVKDPTGVLWHNFNNYDSKKMTGYVGLKNQGATCYMNSLFQSLYCTNGFRKAVYQIPTVNDEPTKSVALAMQRVFYNLQFSDLPVGTTELTKSFGWDSLEAFMQHDVQEFNRVLQDNLEIKMKQTPADGAIKNLFVGTMKSYIKCINVNYESSRTEDYYDIQLNVKGCKDLRDSFRDYIEEETLEGDNKYMAEGHGLQDAKKGVIFESFPPVLHLQLKRFEYDIMRDTMVKINDRHEFPLEIDLGPYLDSSAAAATEPHKYLLHGVLVHSGDLSGGHYFAFVKPKKDGNWLKFDDDRVVPATLKEVLEENYGGDHMPGLNINGRPNIRGFKRFTNAYMLVYIRESEIDSVLANVTNDDIPHHLALRLQEERQAQEKKMKEKEQQHLFMKAIVVTDDTFKANTGFDFANIDERCAEKSRLEIMRVRKDQKFGDFKRELSAAMGLPETHTRLWFLVNRQNRTIRPDAPVLEGEDNSTLEEVRQRHLTNQTHLRLYIEKADPTITEGQLFYPPPGSTTPNVLVFIKHFDPVTQAICGVGHVYVIKTNKVISIMDQLNRMLGYPVGTLLDLYEEIKPTMIEKMDLTQTFTTAEIQDGDIIAVQKQLTNEEIEFLKAEDKHINVPAFMKYQLDKVDVRFTSQDGSNEFMLALDKHMKHDEVAVRVANKLSADPEKIRFFVNNIHNELQPVRRTPNSTLGDIQPTAIGQNLTTPTLVYEILDISLAELESKRSIRVILCTPTLRDINTIDLLLPKQGKISDLLMALDAKGAKFESENGTNNPRIFEAINNKFSKVLNRTDAFNVLSPSQYAQIYIEETPTEEIEADREEEFIKVFHFQREALRTHSVPFIFLVKKDEPFEETKARLQLRTGLSDKDWSKVKFNIVSSYSTTPISEEAGYKLSDHTFSPEESLGLDHIDKTGRSTRIGTERALSIRG